MMQGDIYLKDGIFEKKVFHLKVTKEGSGSFEEDHVFIATSKV
jgi:hypothetical protein